MTFDEDGAAAPASPFHPDWHSADDLPPDFNDVPEAERERLTTERVRLLHIYGAPQWHSSVEIVGNRNALTVLRDAITASLAEGAVSVAVMANDGEGYAVEIEMDDRPWSHPAWEARPPHYVDPIARGEPTGEWKIPALRNALCRANAALVKRGVRPIPDPTQEVNHGER